MKKIKQAKLKKLRNRNIKNRIFTFSQPNQHMRLHFTFYSKKWYLKTVFLSLSYGASKWRQNHKKSYRLDQGDQETLADQPRWKVVGDEKTSITNSILSFSELMSFEGNFPNLDTLAPILS